MDDRSLVSAVRSAGPRGLSGVYDGYADRLLAYAVTLVRDPDAAADAVRDALHIAGERAGQLPDPDRLRPWLYAIVRTECLRRLRGRRRSAPDPAGAVPEHPDADPSAPTGEPLELVRAAAAALDPAEREVLELTARHGLPDAELAATLGVDAGTAHALSSRARLRLERNLDALLVARAGRAQCPELAGVLAGWDGRLTPPLRKRLDRHVDACGICGETKRRKLDPVALLAGVPFVLAPASLRERVLHDISYRSGLAGLAERAGPWQPDGFPVPPDRHRRVGGSPIRWSAAAVVVLALLVTAGLLARSGGGPGTLAGDESPQTALPVGGPFGDGDSDSGGKPANRAATPPPTASPTIRTPRPGRRTGTPPPAGSPTPTGTPVPASSPAAPAPTSTTTRPVPSTPPPSAGTPSPTPTTTPPAAPAITTRWAVRAVDCPYTWRAELTATVTGVVATAVTASLSGASGVPSSVPMTSSGPGAWTVLVTLPANRSLSWTAVATTPAGRLTSAPRALGYTCTP